MTAASGYTLHVVAGWVPIVVAAVGVAAAWGAPGHAVFVPLLWLFLLVVILALPPRERRLIDGRWLGCGLGVLALSFVVAADHELALRHGLLFLAAALLFGLARRSPLSDGQQGALAVGIALTGVVALAQACGGLERAQALVVELPREWRLAAATRLATGRVFGTATLPGHFAALMLLCVPLLGERAGRVVGWGRAGWCILLTLAIAAAAFTRSLAALFVGGVLLLLIVGQRRGRWWPMAASILVMVTTAVLLSRHDLGRLEPLHLRWVNWRTAVWVFAHHPWLGVGLGGAGQAGLVAPTAASNITPYTHNTYLQLLAELGLAGVGVLIAGIAALARLLLKGMRALPWLAAAVAVVPLHNLVDFSAYAPEVLLPWAVLAGTLAGRLHPLPMRPLRGGPLLALLGGGAVLATMAWRGEAELVHVVTASAEQATAASLASARWTPWTITPLELGAALALDAAQPAVTLAVFERELAARAWVRPLSASWAETRARLLVAQHRPGEALVWAREARRRAPWRGELAGLEAACSPGR